MSPHSSQAPHPTTPLAEDVEVCIEKCPETASSDTEAGENACSICLEQLDTLTFQTVCGHRFHRSCLVSWRQASKKSCPLCRHPLERGLTPVNHTSPPKENDYAAAIRAAAQRSRSAFRRQINISERLRQNLYAQAQTALQAERDRQLQQLESSTSDLSLSDTYHSTDF